MTLFGFADHPLLDELQKLDLVIHNGNAATRDNFVFSCDVPDQAIVDGLAKFGGVGRRFQVHENLSLGEAKGVTLIDDYGHHPTEVAAVLKAARGASKGQVIAVIQPHRYTRLRDLFDE